MGDGKDNTHNQDNSNYMKQQGMYTGENPKGMGNKILKPIVQEKIVKVPVTQYVEKIIEREEVQYVNKYVDVVKPIITYKTKHVAKPIYLDKIKYETKVYEKEKIIHVPKIEYKNKIVEVPVYVHREKIIEKKVPLIIERVIPVLKVRTQEQHVLTDTVAMVDICDMSQNDSNKNFRIVTERQSEENSSTIAASQGNYVPHVKNNVDEMTMKTYRLHQESTQEETVPYNNTQEKKYHHDMSSATSIVNEDAEFSIAERMHVKHDTAFNESSTEEINVEEGGEEEQEKIQINIHTENTASDGFGQTVNEEQQQYYNSRKGSECRSSRISINVSEPMRESDIYEQKISSAQSNYNMSTNNLMNMNNTNAFSESGHLNPMYSTNKSISEQVFNRSSVQMDPKVYSSFSVQGNYQDNCVDITQEKLEIEQNYTRTSVTPISREQFNSLQNTQAHRMSLTPSKQSFRPAYANSNGQTMMSIRPATIVEQKSKNKKARAPMCNFLNQCCGGGNQQ